jgi:D-sedoheptulose 7-phosphate isomerase
MKVVSNTLQLITERLRESAELKTALLHDEELVEVLDSVAQVCVSALNSGRKLIFCGNGGSAADAQHLTAELVGRYLRERTALAAIALTTNSSCLTAIGNDYSYEEIFSRQIEALGNRGDIVIGISTSGNSPNIIQALRVAKRKEMTTIAMTGKSGGKLRDDADFCLRIPSQQTPRIQEAHILLGHILCEIIEESLAG